MPMAIVETAHKLRKGMPCARRRSLCNGVRGAVSLLRFLLTIFLLSLGNPPTAFSMLAVPARVNID
jgi:hypothetical protein